MTIDKQIEEALEWIKLWYANDVRALKYVDTPEKYAAVNKTIIACLQAVLEEGWHGPDRKRLASCGAVLFNKEIKTRVKEILDNGK